MLVNNQSSSGDVKFISYTGEYPNLCRGVLTLLINGEEVKFGHESGSYDVMTNKFRDNNYDEFWRSGGSCSFSADYSQSFVETAEWIIDIAQIPEKYRVYAAQIDEIFNENVEHGCCGGCL